MSSILVRRRTATPSPRIWDPIGTSTFLAGPFESKHLHLCPSAPSKKYRTLGKYSLPIHHLPYTSNVRSAARHAFHHSHAPFIASPVIKVSFMSFISRRARSVVAFWPARDRGVVQHCSPFHSSPLGRCYTPQYRCSRPYQHFIDAHHHLTRHFTNTPESSFTDAPQIVVLLQALTFERPDPSHKHEAVWNGPLRLRSHFTPLDFLYFQAA